MSAPQICNAYARPLVSGLLLLDGQKETTHLQESFQNLIGIASQAIINRQHQNSDTSRPLQSDPAAVLKAVGERLRTVASGRYQVASSEEKRIYIKFDGWLPPESPTDSFKSKWIKPGLFEWANGKLRSLFPSELDDLPSTTHDFPFNQSNSPISALRLMFRDAQARLGHRFSPPPTPPAQTIQRTSKRSKDLMGWSKNSDQKPS